MVDKFRDKVRGAFLGIGIGDAIGVPVETWSAEKIAKVYGRVTEYKVPDGHKWFDGQEAGVYSDDTQLTLAVAQGIIENNLSMDAQAKYHIAALQKTDSGWGHTTREAVRNLANGGHWSTSGLGGNGNGTGNGVAMKIAPLGIYMACCPLAVPIINEIVSFVHALNGMTHKTSLSDSAALTQVAAVQYCFTHNEKTFDISKFAKLLISASSLGRFHFKETLTDDLTNRLQSLFNEDHPPEKLIEDFGGGSCYCYNSLPFTYGFFIRNPHSIESLYDVINAGGDTDSNGSMLGALLGALHGTSIFPQHLIDGLKAKDEILDIADKFAEKIRA